MASIVRLYVDHPLGAGQSVPLSRDQAHYLFGVMRLKAGAVLSLINGRDGEWSAQVAEAGKRSGVLICQAQTKPMQTPPDLWLLFAPIRKERMSFIVEKAVELGAARIMAVQTAFTNNCDRVRLEKLQAQAIEAAEQSGGTYIPRVSGPQKLSSVLSEWPEGRRLFFCDEAKIGQPAGMNRLAPNPGGDAILIGPEGGFSKTERELLSNLPYTHTISLGPRILRAETAAVAAMTLWQSALGDWQ